VCTGAVSAVATIAFAATIALLLFESGSHCGRGDVDFFLVLRFCALVLCLLLPLLLLLLFESGSHCGRGDGDFRLMLRVLMYALVLCLLLHLLWLLLHLSGSWWDYCYDGLFLRL
jgi:di/tricarboxylate transporter